MNNLVKQSGITFTGIDEDFRKVKNTAERLKLFEYANKNPEIAKQSKYLKALSKMSGKYGKIAGTILKGTGVVGGTMGMATLASAGTTKEEDNMTEASMIPKSISENPLTSAGVATGAALTQKPVRSLLKKPMAKTMSALKWIFETKSPLGGAFWAAEAPILILQGAYGRYANERDFRKALEGTGQFDEKTINMLGETYGQELSDLGNVGLESYAVDQTDTSKFREDLEKSGMSTEELVKTGFDMVGGFRDEKARAEQLKQQEIEKRTKEAYENEIGRNSKRPIQFNKGGRVSFSGGGMGRRAFLKLLAALGIGTAGAKAGLLGLSKVAGKKAAVKTGADIATGTQGMPDWFPALVNKVIKEGDDVTTKLATQERQVVHTKKLDNKEVYGDEVTVYRDLDTGDIRVEVDSVSNMGEAPIQMDYKAPSVIDEGKSAGQKTKPEFSAVESEPRVVNWDGDIEFDGENIVGSVDDLLSDTTKLKNYAKGEKQTLKDFVTNKKKTDKVKNLNEDTSAQLDYIENKQGHLGPEDLMEHDDMLYHKSKEGLASGGRVSYFDGGIVSLKKKW